VRTPLTTTSYALLGLLAWNDDNSRGLTGYELKQRADNTLRFYWVSPAMSQIYTELRRLESAEVVLGSDEAGEGRTTRRYRISSRGYRSLQRWLSHPVNDFPVLKHPIALRLLMGHLMNPGDIEAMLERYLDALATRRVELSQVRAMLGDDERYRYPAMVAEWGMSYYDAEKQVIRSLLQRVRDSSGTTLRKDSPAT
jgi:DNA-binding PadR family transcriptional regulator